MRTTRKIGSLGILTVAMGLAVAASGCIIEDSSNPSTGVCYPDLFVNWQVTHVVNNVDTPIACDVAGAASVTG